MLFELLDQLDWPREMALAIAAIDLDAISRILVVQLMLNGPIEQGAHGVLEMSALVWRASRDSFLDLFPSNGSNGQVACRVLDLLEDRTTLFPCPRREQLTPIARMAIQVNQPANRSLAILRDQRRWRDCVPRTAAWYAAMNSSPTIQSVDTDAPAGLSRRQLDVINDLSMSGAVAVQKWQPRFHWEGIISKRTDAQYRSERSENWLKIKAAQKGKFPVVGFVKDPNGVAALYLGKREGKDLVYMGKVGTGWSRTVSGQIRKQLDTVVRPKSKLTRAIKKPKATWVEPKFFADVEYRDITSKGLLRASSFKGPSRRGDS
ncbi:hypothetical protein [Bradyrhizobium liaoningense]|uniref:ATP dependent DNA ligase n=1 Tax=Bradyrhizobium liaoningense TaxID=43992 RepID=UPI0020133360|nr:hypothetical protein [Bradyrhizobium liaoningense]